MSEAPLVLVTGISGYIASWVGHYALKLGYRVRGTVRSLSNEKKVSHLRDLCPGSRYKIELVEADLTSEAGWDAAVAGCTFVLHVASPFPLKNPRHKDELIVPAVQGTLHVLRACSKANPMPRRVIITSSYAAIAYGSNPRGRVYSDEDWSPVDDPHYPLQAYIESKTRAERAAWEFLESLPADKRFEMATVNPTYVMGPMLSKSDCSSADLPKQLLLGEMQGMPDLSLDMVSVLDVARAHLQAMSHPDAPGKRFMVHGTSMSLRDMSAALAAEFTRFGYKPTTMTVSKPLLWALSFFDAQAASILPLVGKRLVLEPRNVVNILGVNLNRNGCELVTSMAYAAINAGIIPDKSKDKTITATYRQPDVDISGIPLAGTF